MKLLLILIFFTININANIIRDSINLSQATYCVDKKWDCLTCDKNKNITKIILHSGEKIIIGEDIENDYGFVAFRGSSNIQNWIDNIQFEKTCIHKNICVETGFYKLFNNIKNVIYKNIPKNNNILITGHSLGSAEATLLAFDLCYKKNISLITFGSPRIGNQEFVNHFKKCNIYSKRITHYFDMIPHLPQEKLGYFHIPNEIWYNQDNSNFKICNDKKNEDNKCSNSCSPLRCTSVEDHLYYLNVSLGSDGDC